MNFAQGGMLAVVNTTDLIALLVSHPKNKSLQRETTTAYVQRETVAVAGIARCRRQRRRRRGSAHCSGAFLHVRVYRPAVCVYRP